MSNGLPLVPDFITRFIKLWADKRLPEPDQQTTLVRRHIYILPTRHGLTFFVTLLVILTGAINYENSLGFMLSFLLGSIGFLGMIYTHQNLNHLTLNTATTRPVFAGQPAHFPITLSSKKKHGFMNIQFQSRNGETVSAHLEPQTADCQVQIPLNTEQRGRLELGDFKVFTEFPLGLFHAWSWNHLDTHCLVYPKPDEHPPHFDLRSQHTGLHASEQDGYDDFAGIREYQKGDAPNHLAWKAIARTRELQTKQFHAEVGDEIMLSWYALPDNMDIERKLSVLCRWVLDADHHGLKYGLQLPGSLQAAGSGRHHRHLCLKSLALFGLS